MRIFSRHTLKVYWVANPRSEQSLKAWFAEAEAAEWSSPVDVKAKYGNASILKEGRVVFNICGNEFRLIVSINYEFQAIYIKFIGTHEEYDDIDAESI
jgi:mRNA interferase HigB